MVDSTSKPEDPPADQPDDDQIEEDPDIDMNIDPAAADKAKADDAVMEDEAIPEPKEPTKKDISLRDFLSKMDDYAPIVSSTVLCTLPFHAISPATPSPSKLDRSTLQS